MIVQVRVDDRLVHGQIALVWSKSLQLRHIVVANDNAAKSETVKATLALAVPTGVKLLVRSVEEAIIFFNNEKTKDVRLFVLTANVKDALKIVKSCWLIEAVNIANVGKFDGIPMSEKTPLLDGFFSKSEIEALKELVKIDGLDVYHQITPEKIKESVKDAIRNIGWNWY